jgi:S-adenosylmethionine decarboxylase
LHTVGRHLIAEYYGCDCKLLNESDAIRERMLDACKHIRVTVIGEVFHRFSPQGVTGIVAIAESHVSIHTWPEKGYAAVDIFTCGSLDPRPAVELLGNSLVANSFRMQEIIRGIPEEIAENRQLLPSDVQLMSETSPIQNLPQ